MTFDQRLKVSLLLLRVGVFIVMVMWTLDKFVNPEHAAAVGQNFYGYPEGFGHAVYYLIGAVQLVVVLAFVAGLQKRISYGLVLIMHAISTFSSYRQYLDAWDNLLFFAAWPMLAACVALYLLREADTLWAADDWLAARAGHAGKVADSA